MTNAVAIAISRIRRSPYQALAAILIMTMTLFLAGSFFILAAGSQAVLSFFESRPEVIGYFKIDSNPDPEYITKLKTDLISTGLVSNVEYTSKEDALKIYSESNKSSPLLLEGVTANLLPASIEVSAFNPQSLRELSDKLKTEPDIFDVQFPEDLVSPFIKWTTSIRIIGMSLVGTHIFITFCIILLIMSVKVVSKKDEIATFQFLGATKFYISLPFIVEGFIYGLVGGFLAWGIAYLVLLYSMGFWVSFLSGIPILPPPLWFMFSVLGGKLLLGGLIGSFGAAMATNRFLNR